MKKCIIVFFNIALVILFQIGCKNDNIENLLIGSWVLDSAITIDGQYFNREFDKKIVFRKNNDYEYSWGDYDVFGNFKGKYFILQNKNRKTKTIIMIPNIDTLDEDSIRPSYMIFDILSISNNRLEGISETMWKTINDTTTKRINERYIYHKLQNK